MDVVELTPAVGVEVQNVNLRRVGDGDLDTLKRLVSDRGVAFVRGQDLDPDAQLEFAERWGDINVNRFFAAVDGQPKVAEVRKEPEHRANIGGSWHTDHSYDQIPAMGSMLYAVEVPPNGGDTVFAGMYAAHDALSEGLRWTLRNMRAVHSSRHVFGVPRDHSAADVDGRIGNPDQAVQDAVHPVIVRHPTSGRPALYVNPQFTVRFEDWTAEESLPLLRYLYGVAVRPEHTIRFRWSPGTLAIWDNRATWHYAINDYHGERRLMHRVTLEGVALEAAT